MKEQIYNFFEHPQGKYAIGVQVIIFLMIFLSVGIVVLEMFDHDVFYKYQHEFIFLNHIILAVFTLEYVLRLVTAPQKLTFIRKPLNVVDFLAIAPNYVELILHVFVDTTELRVIRILRLLRFSRLLRLLKLFKYKSVFGKVFQFQETILEAIFPILIIFITLKGIVWILEYYRLWFSNADLGNLFAIIGFALGIILSQKIGVSYDKFLQVEEAIIRLYSNLNSLSLLLNDKTQNLGTKVTKEWGRKFILLLEDPKADNYAINKANILLFNLLPKREEIIDLYTQIAQDAALCLSKKVRLTPKAYDTLLHQSTILYLALVCVFIPGITGMISIITATYILYGMYNLTQDLDSILGGDFNLINIDMQELQHLVGKKKNEQFIQKS